MKILIVDDEPLLCEIIKQYLELEGFSCLTATSVDDALAVVDQETVQWVISDLRMIGGTGLDLLKVLRERDRKSPAFLLMSAFAEVSDEDVRQMGGQALLAKPLDFELLVETIRSVQP